MSKRRLGKGIDALLGDAVPDDDEKLTVTEISLDLVEPDPDQPRKSFSEASLEELADSIRSNGVIQPIIVEEHVGGSFRIVAGERRFRAAGRAGLSVIPAIVRSFTADEKYEIFLIENVQREDLNPIEEALGYKTLLDRTGLSQEEVAKRLGKNRSTIANSLRLLKLPGEMRNAIIEGTVSAGHARALLSLSDENHRKTLFDYCVTESVSVREAERAAASLANHGVLEREARAEPTTENTVSTPPGSLSPGPEKTGDGGTPRKTPELVAAENQLIEVLGTKVVINGSDQKGKIEVSYFSLEDLNRLLDLFGSQESG